MSRTFVYIRTNNPNADNLRTQYELLEKYNVEKCFKDIYSGNLKPDERLGFSELMKNLESGDILIVKNLSRISRSNLNLFKIFEKLKSMNVKVSSEIEGEADKMIEILGALANIQNNFA
ncbi:MAG: recombinase family protein [Oscillospiraceae bacterium]|jgi:DNA invertase Pin-like site-specific DNA recombinase|nr:recombinase family protein [Oscillospiraceae bacterium]